MFNDVEAILKELLTAAGFSYTSILRSTVAGQEIFSIQTDDARTLIGGHGDTVHALDVLVKKIHENRQPAMAAHALPAVDAGASEADALPRSDRTPMVLIDVNDFRIKQIKDLQAKAMMMAERARSFQYDVELSPMSSYERLIVHTTLADSPHVKTESQGEGRSRRVVIKFSKNEE